MTHLAQNALAVAFAAAIFVSNAVLAREISLEELTDLPAADVVILGEVHDNAEHHVAQAEAIFALRPPVVVFEMLNDAQARSIRPDMFRDAGRLEEALDWTNSSWPDFDMYYPVFLASEGALVFGGAAPREDVKDAVETDAGSAFGDGSALFALDRRLDDREQADREALQQAVHCDALPLKMLAGMVEAQRLRDAYLARAVIAAYFETGGPVVLITGNGHARRDWGVPALLEHAAPDLSVITIGQFEHAPEQPVTFDFWTVTEPVDRPDPCDAFK